MEIIDASEVEVSGEGVASAEVNHRASFYVNLGRNGVSRDLRVHITSRFYDSRWSDSICCSIILFDFFRKSPVIHRKNTPID